MISKVLFPLSSTASIMLFILVGCYSTLSSQSTLNVPADYTTIQEALDAAIVNSIIRVQPGTYYEHLIWPKETDGIHLIGVEGKENTIIDGSGSGRVLSIITTGGLSTNFPNDQDNKITESTIIDGFTLQNGGGISPGTGIGPDGPSQRGICIYIRKTHPQLKNLIIRDNHCTEEVQYGCAVSLIESNTKISNVDFIDNSINTSATYANGVAAYIDVRDTVIIDNCKFENNHAKSQSWSSIGAIYLSPSVEWERYNKVEITNTDFINNSEESIGFVGGSTAEIVGGSTAGIYIDKYNASMHVSLDSCNFVGNKGSSITSSVDLTINHSKFIGNSSTRGNSIFLYNSQESQIPIQISNSIFSANQALDSESESSLFSFDRSVNGVIFENCQIDNNTSKYTIKETSPNMASKFVLRNSTLANNTGSIYVGSTNVSVSNSILWNNGGFEIDSTEWGDHSTLNFNNNIVKGGIRGIHNIDEDPLLQNGQLLIPSLDSPCIANGTLENAPMTDLLGNSRPLPTGTLPDIGAIEVSQVVSNHIDLQEYSLSLFPNPTNDHIHFSKTVDQGYIYDSKGNLYTKFGATSTVDITTFPNGTYLIVLQKDGKSLTQKFVVVQ